jgi:hypothetical protein
MFMKGLRRAVVAIGLVGVASSAAAQISTIKFDVLSLTGGPISGSGEVTTPTASLAPGSSTISPDTLLTFSMVITGIPASFGPTSTSFGRSDLDLAAAPWQFSIGDDGRIIDLNFFGRGHVNADGYGIDGYTTREFVQCDGIPSANECFDNPLVDRLQIVVTAVPEAGTVATTLAGLAMLVSLSGLLRGRERAGAS